MTELLTLTAFLAGGALMWMFTTVQELRRENARLTAERDRATTRRGWIEQQRLHEEELLNVVRLQELSVRDGLDALYRANREAAQRVVAEFVRMTAPTKPHEKVGNGK